MFKLTLLQQMLVVSIAMSTITCTFVQKTKRYLPCSSCLSFYSLIINMVFGIIFCKTFTTIDFPESLWIGLFSFLGADTIYKSLEGKLASYRSLTNKDVIEVKRENLIETGSEN